MYRDRTDGGDQLEEMLSSRTTLIQERNKLLMESNRLEKCPNCEIGLPKFPIEKEPMYVCNKFNTNAYNSLA